MMKIFDFGKFAKMQGDRDIILNSETTTGAPKGVATIKEDLKTNGCKHGVRFPWEACLFATIGALSEVVDALLMKSALNILIGGDDVPNLIMSLIIGASCFFSMAFVGFQLANRKHYSKTGVRAAYVFWFFAGLALVVARLFAGLSMIAEETDDPFGDEEFRKSVIVAVVQFILYIGTGFMTRDSVKILTENNMREYFAARAKYEELLNELAKRRGEIMQDVSILKSYPKYAKRLVRSRNSCQKKIKKYNESTRALIETKMSMIVEPDLMSKIYDRAMEKERQIREVSK